MPRTKPSKPNPQIARHRRPMPRTIRWGEIFTVAEAAAYLRLSEADVLRLVHEQGLPARQLATEWRFLKAAIQDWLRAGLSPRPDFWDASVGAFADDPRPATAARDKLDDWSVAKMIHGVTVSSGSGDPETRCGALGLRGQGACGVAANHVFRELAATASSTSGIGKCVARRGSSTRWHSSET